MVEDFPTHNLLAVAAHEKLGDYYGGHPVYILLLYKTHSFQKIINNNTKVINHI